MNTIDLKKDLKAYYKPPAKKVEIVQVPRFQFIMADGEIEPGLSPGTSPMFEENMGALYGAAYTLKFMLKLRPIDPVDYPVMALEGLWDVRGREVRFQGQGQLGLYGDDPGARPDLPRMNSQKPWSRCGRRKATSPGSSACDWRPSKRGCACRRCIWAVRGGAGDAGEDAGVHAGERPARPGGGRRKAPRDLPGRPAQGGAGEAEDGAEAPGGEARRIRCLNHKPRLNCCPRARKNTQALEETLASLTSRPDAPGRICRRLDDKRPAGASV